VPSTDDQQATTMNRVLINLHNRRVNKYFIFVLALTLLATSPAAKQFDAVTKNRESE
jgi:hypothetical protein